jgi:RNA polymerase primary sigma factor
MFLAPELEGTRDEGTRPTTPNRSSAYLSSLYGLATLVRPEDEARLFLRMNYLKHLAGKLREALDPEVATEADFEEVERVDSEVRAVRDTLVRANLRLVVSIAKNRAGPDRLSFEELVSEGNLTLVNAVDGFDASRGYKFSTYAVCAILRNLNRAAGMEGRQRGRFVTGNEALLDEAPAPYDDAPEPDGDRRTLRECVRGLLDRLSNREREVLAARFGLGGDAEKTFQQLGEEMGLTRERVRQIQTRALEKLQGYAGELGLDPTA